MSNDVDDVETGSARRTSELASNRNPQARFSRLSEKLRQVTPDDLQCSVFCGGKKCKYESGTQWESKDMAIDGLFSHWVTDEILACARPNANSIDKHGIIDQFKRCNIKSIINLQSRGEHSKCGPTLHESGFSYDPQVFMKNNIFFYNYSIKDYGVASRDFVLDMVKVVAFALTEGKVAIHCHAGLGRTGVLIACYLVYALRVQANDAIRYIRIKRPNSIQTRNQITCVQGFSSYISPSFVIFANEEDGVSLLEHLKRQKRILHGYEARILKYTPKLVYAVCERLLHLCRCSDDSTVANGSRRLSNFHASQRPFWKSYIAATTVDGDSYDSSLDMNKSVDEFSALTKLVAATVSQRQTAMPPSSPAAKSAAVMTSKRHHLRRGSSSPALMQAYINCLDAADQQKMSTSTKKSTLEKTDSTAALSFSSENSPYGSWDQVSVLSEAGSLLEVPLDDDCSIASSTASASSVGSGTGVSKQHLASCANKSEAVMDVTQNACFKELMALQDELKNDQLDSAGDNSEADVNVPAEDVAKFFINLGPPQFFDNNLRKKCQQYQEQLNSKALAWSHLSGETDPKILLALLISWFYTLQRPVLNEDELAKLKPCDKDESMADVIGRLSTVCRFVVEYLVRFVHRLRPLSEVTRNELLNRVADLLLLRKDVTQDNRGRLAAVDGFLKMMGQQIASPNMLAESPVSR